MKRGGSGGDEDAAEASLARSARRFALTDGQLGQLSELVAALAAESAPPTAIRTPAEIADRHVADSLAALELEEVRASRRIADVGAGAGFPGLPLAIALPNAAVDLIDSARRKGEVADRLARAARATNARTVTVRAEEWAVADGREAYDVVTARAVADLAVLVEYAAPLLRLGGILVAWKGRRDRSEEDAAARAGAQLGLSLDRAVSVAPFPGARDRHLHVFVKVSVTPPGYPRRPGKAVKRPLG